MRDRNKWNGGRTGYVWHITHRCHKKEFLLKFVRDKRRWLKWLFEAKKRYGLSILNYMVTSNHIHLMVSDGGDRDTIPKSIQLLAGRTGQEYNQRKGRKGAFWEDRYHATAVALDEHLFMCMEYIDMNMVRAGVVEHPEEWPFCGYNEIQNPRQRYSLIDYQRLLSLLQMKEINDLQESCRKRVEINLTPAKQSRDSKWTESIAVGSKAFIKATIKRLGIKAKGRKIIGSKKSYELREPSVSYGGDFTPDNGPLRVQNTYSWDYIP
ncbi:MAG: transposase [Deltaproteobacteria bacterium]|nr:transposase [Deltaproteobacteria bacterium]